MNNDYKDATYWNNYYASNNATSAPLIPSQFAAFIANEYIDKKPVVIDFGCGNGRDSRFFSSVGYSVIGVDASKSAIQLCNDFKINGSVFINASINEMQVSNALQSHIKDQDVLVYARFFLHSINEESETAFLTMVSGLLTTNSLVALEFRTDQDKDLEKATGKHYRRYVNPQEFTNKLANFGLTVKYTTQGFGYAKFKNDDAHVVRYILTKA